MINALKTFTEIEFGTICWELVRRKVGKAVASSERQFWDFGTYDTMQTTQNRKLWQQPQQAATIRCQIFAEAKWMCWFYQLTSENTEDFLPSDLL